MIVNKCILGEGPRPNDVSFCCSGPWPFGKDLEWLCQMAHSCQGFPVFMSSMAIVAIGKGLHYKKPAGLTFALS